MDVRQLVKSTLVPNNSHKTFQKLEVNLESCDHENTIFGTTNNLTMFEKKRLAHSRHTECSLTLKTGDKPHKLSKLVNTGISSIVTLNYLGSLEMKSIDQTTKCYSGIGIGTSKPSYLEVQSLAF